MGDKIVVNITKEDLADLMKKTVDESFERNRTDFYIEPEIHYEDHKNIGSFFKKLSAAGQSIQKVILTSLTLGVLGFIGFGLKDWLSK